MPVVGGWTVQLQTSGGTLQEYDVEHGVNNDFNCRVICQPDRASYLLPYSHRAPSLTDTCINTYRHAQFPRVWAK